MFSGELFVARCALGHRCCGLDPARAEAVQPGHTRELAELAELALPECLARVALQGVRDDLVTTRCNVEREALCRFEDRDHVRAVPGDGCKMPRNSSEDRNRVAPPRFADDDFDRCRNVELDRSLVERGRDHASERRPT
jgi:hypothetical protein